MSHYISITKELLDEDFQPMLSVDMDVVMTRLFVILDDFDHEAVTVKPCQYIWGKKDTRDTHKGFEMGWAQEAVPDLMKLGGMAYAVNKSFAGAKCCVSVDGVTIPFFPGSGKTE